jgi:hypothetical protein
MQEPRAGVCVCVCVCDDARACMHALEFGYLPALGRLNLLFCIGFFCNSNGVGPQGMELRNAASTPSRWFPATFIDGSSTFEFPEEERLQLRMKFLYPEYLCCLSAVVDAATPAVEEAQTTFVADTAAAPPLPSAFDAAEALLTQLVTMQVHQHLTFYDGSSSHLLLIRATRARCGSLPLCSSSRTSLFLPRLLSQASSSWCSPSPVLSSPLAVHPKLLGSSSCPRPPQMRM